MCGIGCLLEAIGDGQDTEKCKHNAKQLKFQEWWDAVLWSLQRRGPDYYATHNVELEVKARPTEDSCLGMRECGAGETSSVTPAGSCMGDRALLSSDSAAAAAAASAVQSHSLQLCSSVLHLRGGDDATPQPLVNPTTGNQLLWNGEIFGGIEVGAGENDGAVLLEYLSASLGPGHSREEHVLSVFSNIRGPWAMIFWQADERRLWFGRDYVGRRSLLWSCCEGAFALSSVGGPTAASASRWSQVPAIGLFSVKLESDSAVFHSLRSALQDTVLYQWSGNEVDSHPGPCQEQDIKWTVHPTLQLECPVGPFNAALPEDGVPCSAAVSCDLWSQLSAANTSQSRNSDGSRVGTCGDGGQDSACSTASVESTALRHCWRLACDFRHVLSMAVQKRVSGVPCRHTARTTGQASNSSAMAAGSDVRCCAPASSAARPGVASACALPRPTSASGGTEAATTTAQALASAATRPQPRVAVLFSGGVDCMVLAALAGEHIPADEPIDLINVAFEQKIKPDSQSKKGAKQAHLPTSSERKTSPFDVPDRRTSLTGILELDSQRSWNFVEVNVSQAELNQLRKEHVAHLVAPCSSILDDSIGSAIWFAARGRGRLLQPAAASDNGRELVEVCDDYVSPAKVVLVGMGADEQLGGYSRHRQKFLHHGWKGLVDEIHMDISRISNRNLGRDDRVISDHGREARFPFLDEDVMTFLNKLPIQDKVNMNLERGGGEKILLRNVARCLGLAGAAGLPKRAIQFGSRIANSAEKGADKSDRLAPTPG